MPALWSFSMRRLALGMAPFIVALAATAEAIPLESWDKRIFTPNRFDLVMGGAAVLDRETGLVWEQSPSHDLVGWFEAVDRCYRKTVGPLLKSKNGRALPGPRKGWRLPTVEELSTLIDPTEEPVTLPAGHPFEATGPGDVFPFWTVTTDPANAERAYLVFFGTGALETGFKGLPGGGGPGGENPRDGHVWCVRGGHGYDGGH